MARIKGQFPFSGNLELQKGAPIDARTVVEYKSDLISTGDTWNAQDGSKYLYKGLVVYVIETNELYTLIDDDNYSVADYSGWKKIALDDEIKGIIIENEEIIAQSLVDLDERLSGLTNNFETLNIDFQNHETGSTQQFDTINENISDLNDAIDRLTNGKQNKLGTITLSGDVTGTTTINGSTGITIETTVKDNSHSHTSSNISDVVTAASNFTTTNNSKLTTVQGVIDYSAKKNHAATATTYGVGTTTSYGHNKIISGDVSEKTSLVNGESAAAFHNHDSVYVKQSVFDAIVSGNTTDAIDTFQEVTDFLKNIENSEDLDSIIAAIRQDKQNKLGTITLSGDVTGTTTINGSTGITIETTVKDNSHSHVSGDISDAITSGNLINNRTNKLTTGKAVKDFVTTSLEDLTEEFDSKLETLTETLTNEIIDNEYVVAATISNLENKVNTLGVNKVTYDELCSLVNSNSLVPGSKYRITDYVTKCKSSCILYDESSTVLIQSAEHPFDIIVDAISQNQISDDAHVCTTENITWVDITGDDFPFSMPSTSWKSETVNQTITSHFINKGWFSSNSDLNTNLVCGKFSNKSFQKGLQRFTISYSSGSNKINLLGVSLTKSDGSLYCMDLHKGYTGNGYSLNNSYFLDIKDAGSYTIMIYADKRDGTNSSINSNCQFIFEKATQDVYFSNNDLESWEIKYSLDNDVNRFTWADTENGKGVIYYMKDEYDNEAWYDFKNILFARDKSLVSSNLPDGKSYFYTFTRLTNDRTKIKDSTVYFEDINEVSYSVGNKIGLCLKGNRKQFLNNIVFSNTTSSYNNTIGNNKFSRTFNYPISNSFFGFLRIGTRFNFDEGIGITTYDGKKTKSVIASNIDKGELKVLSGDTNYGFITRTKGVNSGHGLPNLEILSTDGYYSYTYKLPKLGARDENSSIVLSTFVETRREGDASVCIYDVNGSGFIKIGTGSGITAENNGLRIKLGSGLNCLSDDNGFVFVQLGEGLGYLNRTEYANYDHNSSGIKVNLAPGLNIDSSNRIAITCGTGLHVNTNNELGFRYGDGLKHREGANNDICVKASSGITVDSNGVKVKNGIGLGIDTGSTLYVKANSGITVDSNGVKANIGTGLVFDSYGVIHVNVGTGLSIDDSKRLTIKTGNGIEIGSGDVIKLKTGSGITVDNSGVRVNIGTGLSFAGNDIAYTLGEGLVYDSTRLNDRSQPSGFKIDFSKLCGYGLHKYESGKIGMYTATKTITGTNGTHKLEAYTYNVFSNPITSLSIQLGTATVDPSGLGSFYTKHYMLEFKTSSLTLGSISFQPSVKWANGINPVFEKGRHYLISITNGLGAFSAYNLQ